MQKLSISTLNGMILNATIVLASLEEERSTTMGEDLDIHAHGICKNRSKMVHES